MISLRCLNNFQFLDYPKSNLHVATSPYLKAEGTRKLFQNFNMIVLHEYILSDFFSQFDYGLTNFET